MHLTIVMEPETEVCEIPVQYNRLVQSAIYKALSGHVGGFFHDTGFTHDGRSLKMFTFSRLMGKSSLDKRTSMLRFFGPITLVVASPIPQFCSSLASGLLKGRTRIGHVAFDVRNIEVSQPKVEGGSVDVKMLSPTVVYSTMRKSDGGKYTHYFLPGETEFEMQTRNNLIRKYQILTQEGPGDHPTYRVKVKSRPKQSILNYKGTVIKGYTCFLRLTGPNELLQVAIDAGLGSKNSQGFGCLIPDTAPTPTTQAYT